MKIQKTDKQEERNFYMQCSEQSLKAITGKSEVEQSQKSSQNKNPNCFQLIASTGIEPVCNMPETQ